MAQQIGDKITTEDCLAYAEACEVWAARAPGEAARKRLLEMGRSWRDLGRHLQGTEAADQARSADKPGKSRHAKSSAKLKPVRATPRASRRPQ
jgi:hypothetical protein